MVLLIAWSIASTGVAPAYLNIPSAVIVGAVIFGGLIASFPMSLVLESITAAMCAHRHPDPQRHKVYRAVLVRGRQLGWAGGLIGTLIGAVSMLVNMTDPSAIGPGMALSMLTLLYGLIVSEFVFGILVGRLETLPEVGERR